ncbi:hypothetical protein J6590_008506 [Homalodisca vitripennis]|nr:hypothetical protein J6590_008506 [Homalodisca vitripennis]
MLVPSSTDDSCRKDNTEEVGLQMEFRSGPVQDNRSAPARRYLRLTGLWTLSTPVSTSIHPPMPGVALSRRNIGPNGTA